jgi:hypothetical protein
MTKKISEMNWLLKIDDEVRKCHLITKYHNELVPENIALLNEVAGTFFASVIDCYRFNLMHILSRMFDSEKTNGNENISIYRLRNLLAKRGEKYKKAYKSLGVAIVVYKSENLKKDRNKEFMHNDLEFAESRQNRVYKIGSYMKCLNRITEALESIYSVEGVSTDLSSFLDQGSARDLVEYLRKCSE